MEIKEAIQQEYMTITCVPASENLCIYVKPIYRTEGVNRQQ